MISKASESSIKESEEVSGATVIWFRISKIRWVNGPKLILVICRELMLLIVYKNLNKMPKNGAARG